MAKLNLEMDIEFTTAALLIVDEDGQQKSLDSGAGIELVNGISVEDLCFEVVSTNKGSEMSVQFSAKDGKKSSVFEVSPNGENPGLRVKIHGQYSRALRKGADSALKELGESLDLRLRGVTWKGGYYYGFSAPVLGGDFDQMSDGWQETFPRVDRFSVR
jgi:hypothetical protein